MYNIAIIMFLSLAGFAIYTIGNDLLDKVYLFEETKDIDDKIKNYQENVKDTARFEEE